MSRGSAAGGERGQATVEWIGLVLGLALAFGGVLAFARGADFEGGGHELGEALASRLACAARGARGACAAGVGAVRGGGGPSGSGALRERALRRLRGRPAASPDAFGGRGIRPSAPWERTPRGLRGLDGASSGVLRALGKAGRYAWAGCLGYRRLRYDLDQPRFPLDPVPPDEILDELNICLNPWTFLFP